MWLGEQKRHTYMKASSVVVLGAEGTSCFLYNVSAGGQRSEVMYKGKEWIVGVAEEVRKATKVTLRQEGEEHSKWLNEIPFYFCKHHWEEVICDAQLLCQV